MGPDRNLCENADMLAKTGAPENPESIFYQDPPGDSDVHRSLQATDLVNNTGEKESNFLRKLPVDFSYVNILYAFFCLYSIPWFLTRQTWEFQFLL